MQLPVLLSITQTLSPEPQLPPHQEKPAALERIRGLSQHAYTVRKQTVVGKTGLFRLKREGQMTHDSLQANDECPCGHEAAPPAPGLLDLVGSPVGQVCQSLSVRSEDLPGGSRNPQKPRVGKEG